MIDIGGAAEALYQARAAGQRCAAFDLEVISNLDTAYAINDAANARCGSSLKVWKAGGTAPAAWPALGASEPFYSTIPAAFCQGDKARIQTPPGLLGIECEYAFLLSRDLPVDRLRAVQVDAKTGDTHRAWPHLAWSNSTLYSTSTPFQVVLPGPFRKGTFRFYL